MSFNPHTDLPEDSHQLEPSVYPTFFAQTFGKVYSIKFIHNAAQKHETFRGTL